MSRTHRGQFLDVFLGSPERSKANVLEHKEGFHLHTGRRTPNQQAESGDEGDVMGPVLYLGELGEGAVCQDRDVPQELMDTVAMET